MTSNFSTTWFALLALVSGLIMLLGGGECLVSGASKLAKRLGMRPLLIGLTVVAFGTSMPELFVSIKATINDHPNIMLGNVIGSNIANIGLVLALSALLYPLAVDYNRLKKEFVLVIGASLVLVAASLAGYFPRALGVVFTITLAAYTYFAYRSENKRKEADKSQREKSKAGQPSFLLITVLCAAGLVLMWFGSDYFIDGAVDLARFFGLSELVIGLTLAAVGTSLPELASCISAIRKKEGDILVGNILGSNLFNLLLVLGVTALIKPFELPQSALMRDLPVMVAFSAVLVPVSIVYKEIGRICGGFFLLAYCAYIVILGGL